jgi:hypothetical protein
MPSSVLKSVPKTLMASSPLTPLTASSGSAFLLSAAIGLERKIRHKSAGLRTYTVVGTSAALFLLISKYGFTDVLVNDRVVLDPSRVAAQIVTGIGFIGAGLIFVREDSVKSLTTAATVWLVTGVGMACGAGRRSRVRRLDSGREAVIDKGTPSGAETQLIAIAFVAVATRAPQAPDQKADSREYEYSTAPNCDIPRFGCPKVLFGPLKAVPPWRSIKRREDEDRVAGRCHFGGTVLKPSFPNSRAAVPLPEDAARRRTMRLNRM